MKFVAIILALFVAAVVAQENQTNGTESVVAVAVPNGSLETISLNGNLTAAGNGTEIPTSRVASDNKEIGKTESSVKTGKNSATVGAGAQFALVAVSCALAVKLFL